MPGFENQMHWRLIRSGKLPGSMNMAIDEALLEAVAAGQTGPILRLYGWQSATLTLGYGQSVSKDVDQRVCEQAGVDLIRRSTGGRAVLHDHELTYAVIARSDGPPFAGSLLDCYRAIAEVLQAGLQHLEIEASLVPGKSGAGQGHPAHAVCFTAPSQYELVVDGRKIVGSAQKRLGAAFLQHGSIPLTLDLGLLARLLKIDAEQPDILHKIGWLAGLNQTVTLSALENAVLKAFEDCLGALWQESRPGVSEMKRARFLCTQKFAHTAWTMKR